MSDRNTNIDFLKFIGISCIILAHVDTPRIIFQARNFDVSLIILRRNNTILKLFSIIIIIIFPMIKLVFF
jgi:hypothetical protein